MTERYLEGRHAVVTGGGRGIGAAVAAALAARGASLTLLGRDAARLRETAASVAAEHRVEAHGIGCDVGVAEEVEAAFGTARSRLGDPYILVNNAGIAESAPFAGTSLELWERTVRVDLTGVFLCTKQVLPAMQAARDGRVVSIASTAGLRGYNRLAAYCAAKHGVIGLTRALALETAKQGITVNAVCPGYTDTDMTRDAVASIVAGKGVAPEEALAMITRLIPRGRLTRPEEVASLVAWLCSSEAAAVTGAALPVAGGESA